MSPYTVLVRIVERLGAVWYWVRSKFSTLSVDVSQVTPQIWTGATIETVGEIAQLIALGITAVVDCQEEHNDPIDRSKLKYLWDPQTDDGTHKPVDWFARAWEFAKPILAANGKVYCHCQQGHNRGPSMAYFLLRAQTGMAPAAALALIKAKRPVATVRYAPDADQAIVALGLGA